MGKSINQKVSEWAKEKGILKPENANKQYMKFQEEAGELSAAITKEDREKLIDSFGDVQVTLIILAAQLGVDYEASLETAYNVIKDRTGELHNGAFIKSEDLNNVR